MVLFMALAIMTVRMSPLAPTREPATMSTLFKSKRPAKAAAIPDKEFKREITTSGKDDELKVPGVIAFKFDTSTLRRL